MNSQSMAPKPMKTCRQILVWLCVCSCDANTSKWIKWFYEISNTIITLLIVSALFSSVIFFEKFASTNLQESLYAIFQIAGNLMLQNSIFWGFVLRSEIDEVFHLLTRICDLGSYGEVTECFDF